MSLLILASTMCYAFPEEYHEGEGATVKIDVPTEAVIGLPMPIQLTVRGKTTLYPCKLMDVINPFEIRMVSSTHRFLFKASCSSQILEWKTDPEGGHREPTICDDWIAPISIAENAFHEYLVDITHVRLASVDAGGHHDRQILDVPSNTYEIEFYNTRYNTPAVTFDRNRKKIVLVAPNDVEKKLIENIIQPRQRKYFPQYYNKKPILFWEEIILHRREVLEGVDPAKFSEMGKKQLQYHMLLADLVNSEKGIDKLTVPPDELKRCLESYKTEIMLLMYEIELAKEKSDNLDNLRKEILARRPNAEKQLDDMRSQGGTIAHYRQVQQKQK